MKYTTQYFLFAIENITSWILVTHLYVTMLAKKYLEVKTLLILKGKTTFVSKKENHGFFIETAHIYNIVNKLFLNK